MRNTSMMQKPMVGIISALALGACGQSGPTENTSGSGLSLSTPGHRRADQTSPQGAGSAAFRPRELGSETRDRDCDAGADDRGGSRDEPRAHRDAGSANDWQPAAGSGGGAGSGGSAATHEKRRKGRRNGGSAGAGGGAGSRAWTGSRAGAGGSAEAPRNPRGAGAPADEPPVVPTAANNPVAIAPSPGPAASNLFRPTPGTSWQIQLTGDIDTSVNAQIFDLDLFETSEADIAKLHAAGRKVICYFDTAYESYRPDSKQLEPFRGNPIDGWPGQYWVDIRQPGVVELMSARIALAQSKGCDAVDADDVDSRSNNPGFPISAADQRNFVQQLATAAHARGVAFGLKNALEDLQSLSDSVDFSVNEECFVYDECDLLKPLVAAGKPVFQIEYADDSLESRAGEICPRATALGFDTIIKRLDLDAARHSCR